MDVDSGHSTKDLLLANGMIFTGLTVGARPV